ncbi:hypothetical protein PSTT_02908 [Puccinia striiformis]|uniref:Uncharacterized protein n=1 Tax=Puccinia striiformis TaxID=27350 RepID=A0A2S4VY99_9BASI|nr:hypothetical protein PSTT_02908 [Puccinia striiformis]
MFAIIPCPKEFPRNLFLRSEENKKALVHDRGGPPPLEFYRRLHSSPGKMNFGRVLYIVICSAMLFASDSEAIDDILDHSHEDPFGWTIQPSNFNLDSMYSDSKSKTQVVPDDHHPGTTPLPLSNPQEIRPQYPPASSSFQSGPFQARVESPIINAGIFSQPVHSDRQALADNRIPLENANELKIDESILDQWWESLRAYVGIHPTPNAKVREVLVTKRPVPPEFSSPSPAATRLRLGTQQDQAQRNHLNLELSLSLPSENIRNENDRMVKSSPVIMPQAKYQQRRGDAERRRKVTSLESAEISNPALTGGSHGNFPHWRPANNPTSLKIPGGYRDIPKLRFTKGVLTDHSASGSYKRQVEMVEEIFEKLQSEQLVIPEDEVDQNVQLFSGRPPTKEAEDNYHEESIELSQTTSHQKRLRRSAERYALAANRKVSIWKHRDLWYEYWKIQTGFEFRQLLPRLTCVETLEIFPMFLFYVEMITTIIPRPTGEELTLGAELALASNSFFRLFLPTASLEKEYHPLRQQIYTRTSCPSYFKMWAFLNHWLHKQRYSLLAKLIPKRKNHVYISPLLPYAPPFFKTFFNNIFYMSIDNFHLVYRGLEYPAS